jgi:hypothetical protein
MLMLADGHSSASPGGVIFAFIAGPVIIIFGVILITDYRGVGSYLKDESMRFSSRVPLVPTSGATSKIIGIVAVLIGLTVVILAFYGINSLN